MECTDANGKKIDPKDCDDAERPTEILPCNMGIKKVLSLFLLGERNLDVSFNVFFKQVHVTARIGLCLSGHQTAPKNAGVVCRHVMWFVLEIITTLQVDEGLCQQSRKQTLLKMRIRMKTNQPPRFTATRANVQVRKENVSAISNAATRRGTLVNGVRYLNHIQ